MLKVDLPPEYNNWAEVLNEKYRANQEIGQLNIKLTAAAERIEELKHQLVAADKGLLKASDSQSGWQGINKECELWQEKYEDAAERERVLSDCDCEKLRARNAELEETNTKLINDFNDMVEEHGFDQFEISVLKTDIEVLVKRNAELEAQLLGYSSATPSYVKGLEEEVARLRKLYKKWGYADAPCPKHSKEPILDENNCASCRSEALEAEVERLKEDNEILQFEVGDLKVGEKDLKAQVARLRKALDCRSAMKCKCGDELYRVSGLTHYDNRDGIREAAWCDSCRILFSSHAHGLSVIGYLHNKMEASDG